MELRDYINQAIRLKEDQKQLALFLGVSSQQLTNAKAQRAGLPNDATIKLARLLEIDPLTVLAASELATEKKPERREFWLSFGNPAKAARVAGFALIYAIVTNFVTPTPAEAAPTNHLTKSVFVLCKVLQRLLSIWNCFVTVCNGIVKRLKSSYRSRIEASKLSAI